MNAYIYHVSIGSVTLCENFGGVTNLYFDAGNLPKDTCLLETPLLREAAAQLNAYLEGKLRAFSLPLAPSGTPFMQKVWARLCEIPYGRIASYKDIAIKIGQAGSCRAVGLANSRNPIPILIPCHRVIGSDGSLSGYRGGAALKRQLIEMESKRAAR